MGEGRSVADHLAGPRACAERQEGGARDWAGAERQAFAEQWAIELGHAKLEGGKEGRKLDRQRGREGAAEWAKAGKRRKGKGRFWSWAEKEKRKYFSNTNHFSTLSSNSKPIFKTNSSMFLIYFSSQI